MYVCTENLGRRSCKNPLTNSLKSNLLVTIIYINIVKRLHQFNLLIKVIVSSGKGMVRI